MPVAPGTHLGTYGVIANSGTRRLWEFKATLRWASFACIHERRMVGQIVISWNRIAGWLKRIDDLRVPSDPFDPIRGVAARRMIAPR